MAISRYFTLCAVIQESCITGVGKVTLHASVFSCGSNASKRVPQTGGSLRPGLRGDRRPWIAQLSYHYMDSPLRLPLHLWTSLKDFRLRIPWLYTLQIQLPCTVYELSRWNWMYVHRGGLHRFSIRPDSRHKNAWHICNMIDRKHCKTSEGPSRRQMFYSWLEPLPSLFESQNSALNRDIHFAADPATVL